MTHTEFRAIRKRLGLTQPGLAAVLGIGTRHVAAVEGGERTPSDALCRLVSLLDLPGALDRLRPAGKDAMRECERIHSRDVCEYTLRP